MSDKDEESDAPEAGEETTEKKPLGVVQLGGMLFLAIVVTLFLWLEQGVGLDYDNAVMIIVYLVDVRARRPRSRSRIPSRLR